MLEHSDRADGVKGTVSDVSKVLEAKLHEVSHTRTSSPLGGIALLLLGQGHAHDPAAVVASGVDRHRAPATADIEELHPRL